MNPLIQEIIQDLAIKGVEELAKNDNANGRSQNLESSSSLAKDILNSSSSLSTMVNTSSYYDISDI